MTPPEKHAFIIAGNTYGKIARKQMRRLGGQESLLLYLKLCEHQNVGAIYLTTHCYKFNTVLFVGEVFIFNLVVSKRLLAMSRKMRVTFSGVTIPHQVLLELKRCNSITAFSRKMANQNCSKYKLQLLNSFIEAYNYATAEDNSSPVARVVDQLFLKVVRNKTGFLVYDYGKVKTVEQIQKEKRKIYGYSSRS